METQKYFVDINASKEKVWEALWNRDSFREWTKPFCDGSYYEGNLVESENIKFLAPNGNGMNSIVYKMAPFQFMAFKHLSYIVNYQVSPIDEETKVWSGAIESYELKEINNGVQIEVTIEIMDQYADYMKDTFPKALAILKQLSEK